MLRHMLIAYAQTYKSQHILIMQMEYDEFMCELCFFFSDERESGWTCVSRASSVGRLVKRKCTKRIGANLIHPLHDVRSLDYRQTTHTVREENPSSEFCSEQSVISA